MFKLLCMRYFNRGDKWTERYCRAMRIRILFLGNGANENSLSEEQYERPRRRRRWNTVPGSKNSLRVHQFQLLLYNYSGRAIHVPACMNYNRHVKFGIIWGDSECEWGNWRSPPKYKVREWSQSVRSSVTANLVCTWRKKGGGSRVALVQRIGGYECIIKMDVSFCCFLTPSISIHRQETVCKSSCWMMMIKTRVSECVYERASAVDLCCFGVIWWCY